MPLMALKTHASHRLGVIARAGARGSCATKACVDQALLNVPVLCSQAAKPACIKSYLDTSPSLRIVCNHADAQVAR